MNQVVLYKINKNYQNRAKVASENLCELNPDVIGDYLDEVFIKSYLIITLNTLAYYNRN